MVSIYSCVTHPKRRAWLLLLVVTSLEVTAIDTGKFVSSFLGLHVKNGDRKEEKAGISCVCSSASLSDPISIYHLSPLAPPMYLDLYYCVTEWYKLLSILNLNSEWWNVLLFFFFFLPFLCLSTEVRFSSFSHLKSPWSTDVFNFQATWLHIWHSESPSSSFLCHRINIKTTEQLWGKIVIN